MLTGGGGSDTLLGGAGQDLLTGGTGADVFVFRTAAESAFGAADSISDFQTGDLLDLSAIDADGDAIAGNGSFTLSASRTSGATGELVFLSGQLHGFIDADDTADFQLLLLNRLTFGVADFLP